MTAVTIEDLDNAKLDCETIADIATSNNDTTIDRLGNTKLTMTGAVRSALALNPRGAWTTATAYAVKDLVTQAGVVYVVTQAHTSGTFATDLAAGKLAVYQGVIGNDLANASDPNKGADLIGWHGSTVGDILDLHVYFRVDTLADLKALDTSIYKHAQITSWQSSVPGAGGGHFRYDSSSAATANDGDIVAPNVGTGRWLRNTTLIKSSDFGLKGDGTDETTRFQAFLNRVLVRKSGYHDVNDVSVSNADINGAAGVVLFSTGSLIGRATGTYDAVLTIRNSTDVTITGRLPISGNYNSNYRAALACYTDNATNAAKIFLENIITAGVKQSMSFGRTTEPNALISEITVIGGYSYGCPMDVQGIGTQTVVNVIGRQTISDTGSNPAGWSALPRIPIQSIGAQINYTGGEVMLTNVTTGIGIDIQPIADPINGNQYGSVTLNGTEVECASQLCVIRNPNAVGSITARVGGFMMDNCKGVHTQNLSVWVDAQDSAFTGDIKIGASNRFRSIPSRTFANVNAAGAAHLYVADGAFGPGFVQGLSGLVGGIPHFTHRMIFDARNASGTTLVSGAGLTILNYANLTTTVDTARYATNYSAGRFTVPMGGLRDVVVSGSVGLSTLTNNPVGMDITKNGASFRRYPTTSNGFFGGGSVPLGDLAAGDIIDIRASQSSGSSVNPNGGTLEGFTIYARN